MEAALPSVTVSERKLGPLEPHSTGHCKVKDGCEIYYELHALSAYHDAATNEPTRPSAVMLVLVQGFAAGCGAWYPLLQEMQELWSKQAGPALEVLLVENRGLGRSSIPKKKSQYSTTIMAHDVLSIMDHLGWQTVHVAGFSMGGMVSTKLAAISPQRVKSLMLISVTGGGLQALPHSWRAFKLAFKGFFAKNTPDRALVDIKFHFSKHVLRQKLPEVVPSRSVKEVLMEEYLETFGQTGPQPKEGFNGQLHTVLGHSVTQADVKKIRSGDFPVWFVHGRNDMVAMPKFAERLAAKFHAPFVCFNGGHLVFRENAVEVAQLMRNICTDLPNTKRSLVTDLRLKVDATSASST